MSKAIKDLNVPSSSPIGFEVEWHGSRSDTTKYTFVHEIRKKKKE